MIIWTEKAESVRIFLLKNRFHHHFSSFIYSSHTDKGIPIFRTFFMVFRSIFQLPVLSLFFFLQWVISLMHIKLIHITNYLIILWINVTDIKVIVKVVVQTDVLRNSTTRNKWHYNIMTNTFVLFTSSHWARTWSDVNTRTTFFC